MALPYLTHRIQAALSYLQSSHNYPTFITSSLFSVIAVLALHQSLFLLGHLHHPLLKLLIAPFGMLHRVTGINSLYLFANRILVPVPLFSTHLFLHPSFLPLLIHYSAHPQLHLSFTPGLKPTCFTNPTPPPSSFTSSSRTAFTDFCSHGFSNLIGFCF